MTRTADTRPVEAVVLDAELVTEMLTRRHHQGPVLLAIRCGVSDIKGIAKQTGLSERTVSSAVFSLEADQLVTFTPENGWRLAE